MCDSAEDRFLKYDDPIFYKLTMEEKEDIDKQRFNLFKSLSWQDKYNNKYHRVRTHRETIPLNNVSVWAGDYTAGTYYARLDHAISRRMLGACHGATKRTKILPHPSCDHRILEYGCAVVTLNDPLVIEMVRESTIPNKTMLYVDGRIEAEIVSHAPHLPYQFSDFYDGTYEVRRGGELYGTIGHETKGLGYVVVLVRKDGLRMRIPLRVGETNKEAFAALISLLTLKFLWSKEWPENRCRIIDPEISTLISDHDRITYFALSLYLFVSVYGERTLGGSGG